MDPPSPTKAHHEVPHEESGHGALSTVQPNAELDLVPVTVKLRASNNARQRQHLLAWSRQGCHQPARLAAVAVVTAADLAVM